MALRPLWPAVSPSPAPVCPSPATIKGRGAPPRPSPHSPRPQSRASESTAPPPPSVSSAECSPLSPGCVRPSAALPCRWCGSPPSPLHFSSTMVRFRARGRVPADLRRASPGTVTVVHRGPAPLAVDGRVVPVHDLYCWKIIR
jgi:hypothetical protein